MSESINVMVMGGRTKGFHQFEIMGPIYREFLSAAGFAVTLTEDREDFTRERLAKFDVVLDYTTGEDLTDAQRDGLLGFIIGGKGFVGIHSAADSFKGTAGYIPMVGGKFLTHPPRQPLLTFHMVNPEHPVTAGVPDFAMEEEIYLMETYGHFELLVNTRYRGVERPVCWSKGYGMGRVVYCALGHGEPQTRNLHFQKLVINALRWVKDPGE